MDSLIPFTDAMNELWGLPHNDTATSQCRRNKALMHQTLCEAMSSDKDSKSTTKGLRYGAFFLITEQLTNRVQFEEEMTSHGLSWPIVIKPPTSGGTEGVRLCWTFEAAQKVVFHHLHRENGEKNVNESMMAQEFLDGEEYVVNSVSFDSNHKFSDLWRAHKRFQVDKSMQSIPPLIDHQNQNEIEDDDEIGDQNNKNNQKEDEDDEEEKESESVNDDKLYPFSMLYEYQQFVSDIVNDPKMQCIVEYVERVLNALGVCHGSGHCEVMYLPKEERVCLIELNARLHGGMPRATKLVGYDQMSLLALSHCDPGRFLVDVPKQYVITQSVKENEDQNQNENQNENENEDEHKEIETENGSSNTVTVRSIFLRSAVDGVFQMDKVLSLQKLKTFKMFGRQLYDGTKYWSQWKEEKATCLAALEAIGGGDDDENGNDGNADGDGDHENDGQREEYLKRFEKACQVMDRIQSVQRTIDLITSPGAIVLEGRLCDIERDYKHIRALEEDTEGGLYMALQAKEEE